MLISVEQLNQELESADWPVFNSVVVDETNAIFEITIDSGLRYFEGHFPQQAVVPGVVQVHWVGELARRIFNCDGFTTLKKIKFANVILPSMSLHLHLVYKAESGNVSFNYKDESQSYSSGVLTFNTV